MIQPRRMDRTAAAAKTTVHVAYICVEPLIFMSSFVIDIEAFRDDNLYENLIIEQQSKSLPCYIFSLMT